MGTAALERVGQERRAQIFWRVVREGVLLATLFLVYSAGRQFAARHTGSAFDHAHEVLSVQNWLHLPNEASIQHWVLRFPHLVQGANLYYAGVHAPLTAAVLLWLSIW